MESEAQLTAFFYELQWWFIIAIEKKLIHQQTIKVCASYSELLFGKLPKCLAFGNKSSSEMFTFIAVSQET